MLEIWRLAHKNLSVTSLYRERIFQRERFLVSVVWNHRKWKNKECHVSIMNEIPFSWPKSMFLTFSSLSFLDNYNKWFFSPFMEKFWVYFFIKFCPKTDDLFIGIGIFKSRNSGEKIPLLFLYQTSNLVLSASSSRAEPWTLPLLSYRDNSVITPFLSISRFLLFSLEVYR